MVVYDHEAHILYAYAGHFQLKTKSISREDKAMTLIIGYDANFG